MPLFPYVLAWLRAFALTVAIEVPIAAFLVRREEPRLPRRLVLLFFANLASHPAVWFVFPALGLDYELTVLIAEAWAFGSEALFYRFAFTDVDWRRAVGVSALANGASFGTGLVLRALTGWV